jgi:hypothetical protein
MVLNHNELLYYLAHKDTLMHILSVLLSVWPILIEYIDFVLSIYLIMVLISITLQNLLNFNLFLIFRWV